MKRILIVTDAWHPQVNGVVRSIEQTNRQLEATGVTVVMLTPSDFKSVPCPTYPEIRLSLATYGNVARHIEAARADHVHIATEGPLGYQARRWCLAKSEPFTTSYHTRFPEYVAARVPIPASWLFAYARSFHNAGNGCMVATESLERELAANGVRNLRRWSRGIDQNLFRPRPKSERPWGLPRPIFISVGRVAVEKNLDAFLSLDLPGSKVIVGDGPARAGLQAKYPSVHFTGMKHGEDLAAAYAEGDVFVFPSLTDTFGNAIIESMASGVPVAAFPVTGPLDILTQHPEAGQLDKDLRKAALAALDCKPEAAIALARTYSWEAATRQFMANIMAAHGLDPAAAEPDAASVPA